MASIKVSKIEKARKWQYRTVVIKDRRLKGFEIATNFGYYEPIPRVTLNDKGELVVVVRQLIVNEEQRAEK